MYLYVTGQLGVVDELLCLAMFSAVSCSTMMQNWNYWHILRIPSMFLYIEAKLLKLVSKSLSPLWVLKNNCKAHFHISKSGFNNFKLKLRLRRKKWNSGQHVFKFWDNNYVYVDNQVQDGPAMYRRTWNPSHASQVVQVNLRVTESDRKRMLASGSRTQGGHHSGITQERGRLSKSNANGRLNPSQGRLWLPIYSHATERTRSGWLWVSDSHCSAIPEAPEQPHWRNETQREQHNASSSGFQAASKTTSPEKAAAGSRPGERSRSSCCINARAKAASSRWWESPAQVAQPPWPPPPSERGAAGPPGASEFPWGKGILLPPPGPDGVRAQGGCRILKAEVRRSFITTVTTVWEQRPRSHHKGATGRVQTGDQRYLVLCHRQLAKLNKPLPTWIGHPFLFRDLLREGCKVFHTGFHESSEELLPASISCGRSGSRGSCSWETALPLGG